MTMLQIRHIPEDVHRRLKSRAAIAGMSLSDYALGELLKGLERPTRQELMDALASKPTRSMGQTPTSMVREARDARSRR